MGSRPVDATEQLSPLVGASQEGVLNLRMAPGIFGVSWPGIGYSNMEYLIGVRRTSVYLNTEVSPKLGDEISSLGGCTQRYGLPFRKPNSEN